MRSTHSQRAHGSIDDVCASLDALQDGHGSQTSGVVAVRDADGFLQLGHQIVASIRGQQASHILDADGVCTHLPGS